MMRKKDYFPFDVEMAVEQSGSKLANSTKPTLYDVFMFSIVVFGWYSTAVVAVTTSKQILNEASYPFSLCFSQFLCATVLTRIILFFHATNPIDAKFRKLVLLIAVSYTFGFIFTNVAFSFASANFAETIKSAEPVSSVLLGYFIIHEVSSRLTYATLLPICAGVALSCVGETDFSIGGFIFAALSNFCFSYRAVVAKQLYMSMTTKVDEIRMFADISVVGLVLMTAITGVMETSALISMPRMPSWNLLLLCAVNGCAYTAYNVLSFVALSRASVMTHAVLNVFRRVVIITFTAAYFSVNLSMLNLLGVAIAVGGVVCFTISKQRGYAQ